MKTRKLLTISLAALTLFSLGACGGPRAAIKNAANACKDLEDSNKPFDIRADSSEMTYGEKTPNKISQCVLKELGFPDSTWKKMTDDSVGVDSYNGIEVSWDLNPSNEWNALGAYNDVVLKVQKD